MWLFEPDRDLSHPQDDADSPDPTEEQGSALERYRMYGRFYERYWSKLFAMTQADMARFATLMRDSGEAMTLTDMARDLIRARLQAGPQLRSGPAPNGTMPSWIVRQWDPGASWREGDRAIVVVASPSRGRAYAPRVSEVIHVKDDRVVVNVDGVTASQVFGLGAGAQAEESEAAEAEMLGIGRRFDEDAQIDFVLWRYGPRIVGRLLHALVADSQFAELEGLWLLRELAISPSDGVPARLAETMFEENSGPVRPDDVVAMLALAGSEQVAMRFGLAQAFGERADLFENVGSAAYPRWALAGPPPLVFTARHSVYDPETYVVLCVAGETLSAEVARQLWRAGLLRAALRGTPEPDVDAGTLHGFGSALRAAERQPSPPIRGPVTASPADETDLRRRSRWRRFSGRG